MNEVKLQTDFLKKLMKKQQCLWMTMKQDENWIGLSDGCFVGMIPKEDFYLDMRGREPFDMTKFIKEFEDGNYILATRKLELMHVLDGKDVKLTYLCGERNDDSKAFAYVKTEYIKYFDKGADYYVDSNKKAVFVLEYGSVVGFILPVLVNKEI